MKVVEIPIEELEIDEMNIRHDPSADEELINSIESQGVLEPLVVRPNDRGGYGIVSGSRRYIAALNVGLETLPCSISELNDIDAMAVSISENRHRQDIPGWRWNEVINEMFERMNGNSTKMERVEKICNKTNMSSTAVRDYLSIGELPPDIKLRMKPEESRSDEEKEVISKTAAQQFDEAIPREVMTRLARDKDFREIVEREPERAHKIVTKAAKLGRDRVGELMKSVKLEPKLEPEEAYKKYGIESRPAEITLDFSKQIMGALKQFTNDGGYATREEAIKFIVRSELKRRGYL